MVVPSTRNSRNVVNLMYLLTTQERSTLGIFGLLMTSGIFGVLVLPLDLNSKILFLGTITIILTCVLSYSFIIVPAKKKLTRSSPYPRYRSLEKPRSFQPEVTPPSKKTKKIVMGGNCSHCGTSTLMGFTCSYCDDYFCSEHRLPEKHGCSGLP